jgi:hypothetical protein
MKTKSIKSKIAALDTRIKSIKSKAENAKYLKESGIFQTLESELEATIVLQKEVDTLKGTLKAKSRELEEGIRKLKKSSKDTGKILKKEKKPVKLARDERNQKAKSPANTGKTGSKKKMAKSK